MKRTRIIINLFIIILITGCSGDYGIDGIDGLNSIIVTLIEQPGVNCSNGGFQVLSGVDLNSNNQLEDSEVDATEFVCNGQDADLGFTRYVSLVSQSGTDNPTSNVLENTLNLEINWMRESQGEYLGDLSIPIDVNNTVILHNNLAEIRSVRVELISSNQIRIRTERLSGFFNDNFDNLSLEIRFYE